MLFIPYRAVELASDKRLLARAFAQHRVPTSETWLFDSFDEVQMRPWCDTRARGVTAMLGAIAGDI